MADRIIDRRRRRCGSHLLRSLCHPAAGWYVFSALLLVGCEGNPSGSSDSATSDANQPPVIHAVQLIPTPPTLEAPLSLAIDAIDPERAPVTFRYRWYVNEASLVGATQGTLDPSLLKRGDRVAVEVVASDGKIDSKPFRLPTVTIGNTPPIVSRAAVEPEHVPLGEKLKAKVEVRDPDQDEIHLVYRWKRNGEVFKDGSEDTLDTTGLKLGDLLQVEVVARDTQGQGKVVLSSPAIVSNGAPSIVSQPKTEIVEGYYEYLVQATDPEGEAVTYRLETAPIGMQINRQTGRITWQSTAKQVGRHQVRIVVQDQSGGTSFQDFELILAAPEAQRASGA